MALQSVSFLDLVTFTRASSGTYFDSAGVMQTATTDVPRFNYEYNGSAWVAKGLLIEPAATNRLLRAREFDSASWAKTDTTITANAANGVGGTATMDLCTEGAAGTALVGQSATIAANSTNTFALDLKRGNHDWVCATLFDNGSAANFIRGWFNLATGAAGSATNGGTGSGAAVSTPQNLGNGIYRCILTGAVNNSATSVRCASLSASADASTTRVSGATRYQDRAQLESGSVATSFIETTTATATRAADVAVVSGTNFSSWFNPTEFTAVLEVNPLAACPVGINQRLLSFSDGTADNRILIYRTNIGTFLQVKSGGSLVVQTTGAILSPGSTSKIAISCKADNFRMSINGGSVLPDSLGAMPTGIDRMGIGYDATAAPEGALAHFSRLTFYPVGSYSDAALQALST